jgi:hypothetical protein
MENMDIGWYSLRAAREIYAFGLTRAAAIR